MSQIKFVFATMAPAYEASIYSFSSGAPVLVMAVGSAISVGKPDDVAVPAGQDYFASLVPVGPGYSGPAPGDTISAEGTFEGDVTVTFGTLVERG